MKNTTTGTCPQEYFQRPQTPQLERLINEHLVDSRSELTAEQLRAIELDCTRNRMILGGPGSGKTQVLLLAPLVFTKSVSMLRRQLPYLCLHEYSQYLYQAFAEGARDSR